MLTTPHPGLAYFMTCRCIFLPRAEHDQTQKILRKVLDLGWYGSGAEYSEYMCHSLRHAVSQGAITQEEQEYASDRIRQYMRSLGDSVCMYWVLEHAGHKPEGTGQQSWSQGQGKKFYRNWDKRPKAKVAL